MTFFPGLDVKNGIRFYDTDIPIVILSATSFAIFRTFFNHYVVERIAKKYKLDKETTLKFKETAWYSFFYPISVVINLFILWDKPWFWDYTYIHDGNPHLENL